MRARGSGRQAGAGDSAGGDGGQDVQAQAHIRDGASHRTGHHQVHQGVGPDRRARALAEAVDGVPCGLVAEHAVVVAGHADGPADIAAEFQEGHAGGQGSACPSGGSAGGPIRVPGIPAETMDVVVALDVPAELRKVCLSKDHGPRRPQRRHGGRIGFRPVVGQGDMPGGGDQAPGGEDVLDGHGQAVKWARQPSLTAGLVGGAGIPQGTIYVHGHDGVQDRIEPFDALQLGGEERLAGDGAPGEGVQGVRGRRRRKVNHEVIPSGTGVLRCASW